MKRKYQKPEIKTEKMFEKRVLACGKCPGSNPTIRCPGSPHRS